ncbi:formate dehydrogenase gamma subunit [Anoxybacillus mongoliensis]|uniref:Formate dehydrogenase gamma subunit n=1 Tax=Anoxybacillus mongoliensis TaxID=452565 RepID=A0A7W8JES6_9BACL|nr:cytochrome b/b6 domain-containing protein [Anoxybacillus mongoliensis]MBB5355655.1 formate dehydrogenase gamma subunit [Anoxybacillus mongoliensis]
MSQKKKNKIYRQPLPNRFVHWGVAISIIMLIITGIGQMPVYGRYLIVQPFGTKWLTSYEITLLVHYFFAATLLFFTTYHIVYHVMKKEFDIWPKKGDVKGSYLIIKAMILGQKEPPSEKYLPEQRIAYLYFVISIGLVIVTGVIKVIKNMMGVQPTNGILFWGAQLHNLATVMVILGVVMHLAAFIVKENRKLLPGMFTGYVEEEYVKERHSLWYKELKKRYEKQS